LKWIHIYMTRAKAIIATNVDTGLRVTRAYFTNQFQLML